LPKKADRKSFLLYNDSQIDAKIIFDIILELCAYLYLISAFRGDFPAMFKFQNITSKLASLRADLQWQLLFLLSTGYMAAFVNIQGIQALMPFIRDEFAITRTQAGLYSTFMFLSATAIAVFSGSIVDKIGSKRGLVFGAVSIGILMIIQGISPVYSLLLILAFITGIGFSIITPSVNKAIMLEVPPRNRAVSMGLMHSGSGVGGFAGATLLPLLALRIGWRSALIISGISAILLGLLVARKYFPDKEGSSGASLTGDSFKEEVFDLLQNRQLMLACMLGLTFGLAVGAIPAHYTLFLTMDLFYSSALAGFALGIVQIGGIFGRTFWGWLSDRLLDGDRKNSFMLLMISIVILKLIYGFLGDALAASTTFMLFISFLLGLSALGWSGLFFTVVSERARPDQTGIASGMSLIFLRTGVVLGPPIFGFLGDLVEHYFYSWLLLGALVFLSGMLYYRLQSLEDHRQEPEES